MTLEERLTQTAKFFEETECRGGRHLTVASEIMEAVERIESQAEEIRRLRAAIARNLSY